MVEVFGQALADAAGTIAVAHVQVTKLRDAGPQVLDKNADASQAIAIESAEGNSA